MALSQSRAPQGGAEWSGSDDEGGEDFLVRKGAPDTHLSDEEEVWWSRTSAVGLLVLSARRIGCSFFFFFFF
jgi:hypothetical protein